MDVIVNDSITKTSEDSSLEEVIKELNLGETKGMAVAINDKVIKRENWSSIKLISNDKVTIIRATQGG